MSKKCLTQLMLSHLLNRGVHKILEFTIYSFSPRKLRRKYFDVFVCIGRTSVVSIAAGVEIIFLFCGGILIVRWCKNASHKIYVILMALVYKDCEIIECRKRAENKKLSN